ncbi:MAG TPA: hypothetical protein VFJ43_14610 [Bacteroidia bacterium]|nr:hypothetical protein [Bacteroidia bacterium]
MKKITAIAALLMLTMTVGAQDWSGNVYKIGEIYPGYYVGLTGDTVQGYFRMGDQVGNQTTCTYYKNETDKKPTAKYGPEDISAYKVGDKMYRAIHYSGGLTAKPIRFNLITKDGAITQFKWYEEDLTVYPRKITEKEVYVNYHYKDNNEPRVLGHDETVMRFAKNFSEFVGDDKELSDKIANKEKKYSAFQMYDIMDEYNEWAKTH